MPESNLFASIKDTGSKLQQRLRLPWILRKIAFYVVPILFIAFVASPFTSYLTIFDSADQLDSSWMWLLYEAFRGHIQFGPNFIFTYGPWGFLDVSGQGASRGLWILSVVIISLIQYAFLMALIFTVRNSALFQRTPKFQRWIFAVVIIPITVEVLNSGITLLLSAVIVLLEISYMAGYLSRGRAQFLLIGLGPFLALDCLVKSSTTLYVLTVVGTLVLFLAIGEGSTRRQSLLSIARLLLSFFVSFICLWLIAGQHIGNIPEFFALTIQIIIGYSAVLNLAGPVHQVVELLVLIGLTIFGLGIPSLLHDFRHSKGSSFREHYVHPRIFMMIVIIAFAFTNWKEGIVRQDSGHVYYTYIAFAIVVVFFAIAAVSSRKLSVVSIGLGIFANVLLVSILPSLFTTLFSTTNLINTKNGLHVALSASANESATLASMKQQRAVAQVPQAMISAIGTSVVALLPDDLVIAPAYGIHGISLPAIQLYSAYTPRLDKLNASFLASGTVPWVLLQFSSPLGTYSPWATPAVYQSLFTNYSVYLSSPTYTLLRWHPHHVYSVVQAKTFGSVGSWIQVPTCARGTTVATFTLKQSLVSTLTDFFFRPPMITASVKVYFGSNPAVGTYKFVWRVSPDGLNMSNFPTSGTSWLPFGVSRKSTLQISAFRISAPLSYFSHSSKFPITFSCSIHSPRMRK